MSIAKASRYMLANTKKAVMAVHLRFLNPADFFMPMTQQGSMRPAPIRKTQAMENISGPFRS